MWKFLAIPESAVKTRQRMAMRDFGALTLRQGGWSIIHGLFTKAPTISNMRPQEGKEGVALGTIISVTKNFRTLSFVWRLIHLHYIIMLVELFVLRVVALGNKWIAHVGGKFRHGLLESH